MSAQQRQSRQTPDAMVAVVTMGGNLASGCLTVRLLTGLGQLLIDPDRLFNP